jgi:UDPglucose 6-dehydrogenase
MPAVQANHRGPIGVLGLWHLGSVTAACLAEAGNEVIGVDPDVAVVEDLARGRPAVSEPGLAELLAGCAPRLRFSSDPRALADAVLAWVTFDTPVDEDDHADVDWVLEHSLQLLTSLPAHALVIVSSQLPVGSVARLAERCAAERGQDDLRFACVPENLRLGQALDAFRAPDRFVAGVRSEEDRRELGGLLAPFGAEVQWMSVESAEMTKHALNGFLATSVAFINEVAAICEAVGADAAEVSRGLKSERRIGPRAYLGPGDAFAGGTLARDIGFLRGLAERHHLPAHVFAGVADGNAAHKRWTERKLVELLGHGRGQESVEGEGEAPGSSADDRPLLGRVVAIWGLTYKPGTDTLRRSSAVELCRRLTALGAHVRAHDPAVSTLPADLAVDVELREDPLTAASGADALVVCTPWPDYREIRASLGNALVIDPAGALRGTFATDPRVRYVRVGSPARECEPTPPRPTLSNGVR